MKRNGKSQTKGRAAITGASGYVGGAMARCFREEGWEVMELGRRTEPAFELGGEWGIDWSGVGALVHCAWDFRPVKWEEMERVNVEGSVRLLEEARGAGVKRGVFVSSMSCFEGCRSMYGRAKLEVEAAARRLGYACVRPGLVYGERPGGMMGTLEKAAQRAPVVPLIGNGRQYPVHEEDLARLVARLAEMEEPPLEPMAVADGEGVTLRELVRRAAGRVGRKPLLAPVPWQAALAGLRAMEWLGLKAPFRSDSLVGFVFQNPRPDFSAAHRLGTFRRYA